MVFPVKRVQLTRDTHTYAHTDSVLVCGNSVPVPVLVYVFLVCFFSSFFIFCLFVCSILLCSTVQYHVVCMCGCVFSKKKTHIHMFSNIVNKTEESNSTLEHLSLLLIKNF